MKLNIIFLIVFVSLSTHSLLAQKEGYWDKERAFKKEIVVSARGRIIIKTDELPTGTTEVVFRITLLDQNQQMAGSLVSLLKSIPDPTGISQGSAGAVFLMSTISGEDKCKYAIFPNATSAAEYIKSGTMDKACLKQEEPISKEVKRLSMDKTLCLSPNSNVMWFGFESKNWIMNQKIVLEIVPWVNIKLSRGWNLENRKSIINQCKSSELAKKLINSDDFCVCVLDKIQKEYKFLEFQKLLPIEKFKVYKDFGEACFSETGASDKVYLDLRNQASNLLKQGKYGEAIDKLIIVIDNHPTPTDFNNLGKAYLMTKQYSKAIKFLKEGEKIDDSELLIQLNLAHSYLLNSDFNSAKSIYKKYQAQNVSDSIAWIDKVKLDFETFKTAGLPSNDFNRILKLLGEKH